MVHVQFANLHSRPMEFLDFTSVTLDAFQQLVPPVEAACQAPMAAWRLDGKPRIARRFSVYQNCPFPTPEERLLFILAYVKTYSLQGVQGQTTSTHPLPQWIVPLTVPRGQRLALARQPLHTRSLRARTSLQ